MRRRTFLATTAAAVAVALPARFAIRVIGQPVQPARVGVGVGAGVVEGRISI